jgi:hypothetical protein
MNLFKQTRDGSFWKGFFDDRLVFFLRKYLLVEIRNDQIHEGTKISYFDATFIRQ